MKKNLLAKDLIKSLKLSLEDGLSEIILMKVFCGNELRNFKEIKVCFFK